MNRISKQLSGLRHAWRTAPGVPDNLSAIGHATISREDMADTMATMALLADLLAMDEDGTLYQETERACAAPLRNASDCMSRKIDASPAQLLGFITFLQQIQATLADAIAHSTQGGVAEAARPLTEKLAQQFEPLEPSARAYNMSLGMAFAKAGHVD